jgi:hypothetical protein
MYQWREDDASSEKAVVAKFAEHRLHNVRE